jgi:hypothetical protein
MGVGILRINEFHRVLNQAKSFEPLRDVFCHRPYPPRCVLQLLGLMVKALRLFQIYSVRVSVLIKQS